MTDPHQPQPPSADRSGCATALMLVGGIVMLLPGACAGFFALTSSPGLGYDLYPLWHACFAVSAGGVALIVWAAQRLRR